MAKNKKLSTSLSVPWKIFFFTVAVIVVGKEAKTHAREDMYLSRKSQNQYQPPPEAEVQLKQPHKKQWSRRIRRNALDNLQTLLESSTAFARIINGIALQSGLLSGTHKIDAVVQELLNFGSIKMPDVVGFKADKITALTSKLTDFKKEVKTGNEVKDQEKMFVELEKIMEESEGTKSLDISDAQYFTDVGNVEQNFDIANMNKVARFVTDALNLVELLKTVPIENTKDIDDDWLKCLNAINHLNNYGLYKTALSTFHKYIKSVAHLETFPEVLEPYRTVIRLIEARAGLKTSGTEALQKNIGQFIELLKVSNSSNGEFSTIYRLIHSRVNPVQMNREVTIGFLNGVTDFDRLLKDLQDPSFATMIGEKKVKKLFDGLKPILSIQSKIDELEGKFGLFSKDSFLSTSQVQMLQVEMQRMSITDKDVNEVLKAIEIPAETDSTVYQAAKDLIEAAETFTKMIQSAGKWAEHLVGNELSEAIKAFDGELNFKDRTNADQSKAEIPAVLKNLKDKDSIKKFQDALTATQSLLNGYTGDSIKAGAASIKQEGLNKFKDQSEVKDEMKFHERLRGNKQKLVTIVEAVGLIYRTQNLDSGEIQKLESLAKAIPEASKLLTAQHLKSITESMKTAENLESKSLGQTTGADRIMKPIAESVKGLQMIHDFNNMNLVADLKTVENEVQKAIGQLKDSVKQGEIRKKWNNLNAEIKSLEAWLQQVSTANQNLVISGSNKLADVGAPFVKLAAIGDLKFDVKSKIEVLIELIPLFIKDQATLDKLNGAKNTLSTLQSLDLEFSKFYKSFNDAPDKFQALYVFIGNFVTIAESGAAHLAQSSTIEAIVTTDMTGMTGTVIIIVLVALLVAVFFVLIICRFNSRCWWYKRVKKQRVDEAIALIQQEHQDLSYPNDKHKAIASEQSVRRDPLPPVNQGDAVAIPSQKQTQKQDPSVPKEVKKSAKGNVQEEEKSLVTAIDNSTKTAEPIEPKLRRAAGHGEEPLDNIVENWVVKHNFRSDTEMADLHASWIDSASTHYKTVMEDKENIKAAEKYLPQKKRRGKKNAICLESRLVDLKLPGDNKELAIHANTITARDGQEFMPTQAPVGPEEGLDGKDDTREDYWMMALIKGTKRIVMLCNKEEKGVSKCGEYFCDDPGKEVTCGRFKAETTHRTDGWPGFETDEFLYRKIVVTDTKNELPTRTYEHYQAIRWPDGNIPTNYGPDYLYNLVKRVTRVENGEEKSPIIVHCSSGIGRTMVFIGMHVIPLEIKLGGMRTMEEALLYLRRFRYNAVQTVKQSIFLQIAVTFSLCITYFIDLSYFKEQYDRFRRVVADPIGTLGKPFYKKHFKVANDKGIPIHNEDKAGW